MRGRFSSGRFRSGRMARERRGGRVDRAEARGIFGEATELAPEERDRFVREQCAGDNELIAEILDLLGALSSAGSYLACDRTGGEPANSAVFPGDAEPDLSGSRVGPYKLLERIGQGGIGVVYMAEQERPVRRTVAVKIIRDGLGSHQVLARFEVERRALAMMNHPNIAHVLDAGATETGQPYFVMEL